MFKQSGDLQTQNFNVTKISNTGMVSSRVSLTSWGEGASLALAGHPSSDVTVKIPYVVDVLLQRPGLAPYLFLLGWLRLNLILLVDQLRLA